MAEGEEGKCVHEWGEDKAEKAMQFKGNKKKCAGDHPKVNVASDTQHTKSRVKNQGLSSTFTEEFLKSKAEDIVKFPENSLGTCKRYGNGWYARVEGEYQYWAKVHKGSIRSYGVNEPGQHRTFNLETGLSAPPRK